MPPEAGRPAITAGGVRLAFDPGLGGRAVSWTVHDTELLSGAGTDPVEHGMYAMAPWAGRLRGNAAQGQLLPVTYGGWALHGTLLARPAVIVEHGSSFIAFATRIGPGEDAWPWPGTVTATWSLDPGGTLHTGIEVVSDAPCAVTLGWHPWFARCVDGADVAIELPATMRLRRGEDALPTGDVLAHVAAPGTYDDAFVVPTQEATLRWGGMGLRVTSSAPWFVVFDQRDEAVCVEPQSGPPDGLRAHSGWRPQVAAPGQPVSLTAAWAPERA